jgi:hypothetical protein
MKQLPFNELLDILASAWAIQFDDFLVFPTVNITDPEDEEPTFEIITPQDEWLIFNQHDLSDCHIDSYGDIKFIANKAVYTITVFVRKELV